MILYKKYQKYMQNSFLRRNFLQTIWRQYQSINALNGILRNKFINHFKLYSSFTWKNNNISYYLHFKKFILTSKFIVGCEMLWYWNKQRWYNDGVVLHFMRTLRKEGETTVRIILVCKMWNKNKSFYSKVKGTYINYILSKYL